MTINEYIATLPFDKEPEGLYAPICYALSAGGKRVRPTLALLAYKAVGGTDEQDILPVAAALEVFHNFTLLHDDLMDHSQTRRGRDCVHVKWDVNTAILSGDQMVIEAYQLLAQAPQWAISRSLHLFNEMATRICEGQQMDMDFEQGQPSMDQYLQMISGKTAALLEAALHLGAYIAKGTEEQQEALKAFGHAIGLAFQIHDDYLDCFGTLEALGKPIGGDIREHKKTYLYILAREGGAPQEVLDSGDYERVTTLYRELGVDKIAKNKVQQLTLEALTLLDSLPQNESTQQLRDLANQLIYRNN